MATKVADVAVRVGADIGPLQSGMRKGSRSVDDFGRKAAQTARRVAAITTAITAAATVMGGKFVRDGLKAVDAQAKLARALDTTIDGLTALQLAGDRSGVSVEAMNSSMERYTARLGEARRGTGQAVDAFRRLGIEAEDMAKLGIDEQMEELGKAFRALNLDASQSADILRDLGIRNADMSRFIREGTADLGRARDMVQKYGLSLSMVDAQKVEQANDAMQEIGLAAEGVRNALAVELSGVITEVSNVISSKFAESGREMREGIGGAVDFGVNKFADLLDGAANVIEFVESNPDLVKFGLLGFLVFGKKGAAIGAAIGGVFGIIEDQMRRMGITGPEAIDPIVQEIEILEGKLADVQRMYIFFADTVGARPDGGTLTDLSNKATVLQADIFELKQSIEEGSDAQRELNAMFGEGAEESNRLAESTRELAEAMRRGLERGDEETALLPDPEEVAEQASEITEVVKDMHRGQLASYRMYYNARVQAAQEAADAELEIERQQKETMLREASLGFSRLTALMDTEKKNQFEIGKAAAISQTVIDTYAAAQASYKALAGIPVVGPGLGAAAAAAAVVGGLARVRAISSRQLSTAGAGGDPGAGSIGSTSGRRSSTQQEQEQPRQNVNLSLVGDTFTRPSVLELIGEINEAIDNGAVIRVV